MSFLRQSNMSALNTSEGHNPYANNLHSQIQKVNSNRQRWESTTPKINKGKLMDILMSEIPFSLLPKGEKKIHLNNRQKQQHLPKQGTRNFRLKSSFTDEKENQSLIANQKKATELRKRMKEGPKCFSDVIEFMKIRKQKNGKKDLVGVDKMSIKDQALPEQSLILPDLLTKSKNSRNKDLDVESIYGNKCVFRTQGNRSIDHIKARGGLQHTRNFDLNIVNKSKGDKSIKAKELLRMKTSFNTPTNSFKLRDPIISKKYSDCREDISTQSKTESVSSTAKKRNSEDDIEKQVEEACRRMDETIGRVNSVMSTAKYLGGDAPILTKKLRMQKLRRKLANMDD